MSSSDPRKAIGKRGEEAAASYLRKHGLEVIASNYRCREGEIDLVAREGEFLVFVEVKTRSSSTYGPGRDAITRTKQRRITRTALHYLAEHYPLEPPPCRFDVAEVDFYRGEVVAVQHIPFAFMAVEG